MLFVSRVDSLGTVAGEEVLVERCAGLVTTLIPYHLREQTQVGRRIQDPVQGVLETTGKGRKRIALPPAVERLTLPEPVPDDALAEKR